MVDEEACSVSNEEEVGVTLLTDSAPFCMWEGSRTDCRDGRIASSVRRETDELTASCKSQHVIF